MNVPFKPKVFRIGGFALGTYSKSFTDVVGSATARRIATFTFIDGLAVGIYGTIFNLQLREGGMSTSAVGQIASSMLWGSALIGLLVGFTADKVDKKTTLVLSHLLSTFFGTYRTLTRSIPALGVTSFFFGGFSAATATVLSALLALKTSNENRARYFGLNFGIGMFTGTLGNLAGGALAELFGFRVVLVVSSLSRLLALLPLLKAELHDDYRDSYRGVHENEAQRRPVYGNGGYGRILLYYFLSNASVGFGAGLFVTFGNVIFYDLFKMSPTKIGLILAAAQLATSVGAVFSYRLGRRFGTMNVLVFSYVFVPILIVALSFVREPITFTSVYISRFAVMNMVSPLLSATVFSRSPRHVLASVSGWNNFLSNVSRALAADLFSLLTRDASGYTLIFLVSSLFYFANAYLMLRMYKYVNDSETSLVQS